MDFVDIAVVLLESFDNLHELSYYFGWPPRIIGHLRPDYLL